MANVRQAWVPRHILCILWLISAAACGNRTARSQSAQPALARYEAALIHNDARAAYALLAKSVQRRLTYDEFAARWKTSAGERALMAKQLNAAMRLTSGATRALATYDDGRTLSLAYQHRSWRLEDNLLGKAHAPSPQIAVRRFAEALSAQNVDAVLAVLTTEKQRTLRGKLDRFIKSLNHELADPKHQFNRMHKSRADLAWDDDGVHYRIVLVREDGEWRIDEVQIQPVLGPPIP